MMSKLTYVPSPSLSKRQKASKNSPICSSLRTSLIMLPFYKNCEYNNNYDYDYIYVYCVCVCLGRGSNYIGFTEISFAWNIYLI